MPRTRRASSYRRRRAGRTRSSRFQYAQRMFDAPTHLLHIAQCLVATGKLVEAQETYETLTHHELAHGRAGAVSRSGRDGQARARRAAAEDPDAAHRGEAVAVDAPQPDALAQRSSGPERGDRHRAPGEPRPVPDHRDGVGHPAVERSERRRSPRRERRAHRRGEAGPLISSPFRVEPPSRPHAPRTPHTGPVALVTRPTARHFLFSRRRLRGAGLSRVRRGRATWDVSTRGHARRFATCWPATRALLAARLPASRDLHGLASLLMHAREPRSPKSPALFRQGDRTVGNESLLARSAIVR